MNAFADKVIIRALSSFMMLINIFQGRVSGMLSTIPVYAVMAEDLGERGAEYIAMKLLKERLCQASIETVSSAAATNKATNSIGSFSFCATAVALGFVFGVAVAKWRR